MESKLCKKKWKRAAKWRRDSQQGHTVWWMIDHFSPNLALPQKFRNFLPWKMNESMRKYSNLWIFLMMLRFLKAWNCRKLHLTPREEDAAELELLLGWMDWSTKIQLKYLPKDGLDHVLFTNWNIKEHEYDWINNASFQFLKVKQ